MVFPSRVKDSEHILICKLPIPNPCNHIPISLPYKYSSPLFSILQFDFHLQSYIYLVHFGVNLLLR